MLPHLYAHVLTTGGGQKLCTGRVVLPVADNIFKVEFYGFFYP